MDDFFLDANDSTPSSVEVSKKVQGQKEPLLEGLYSSFFICRATKVPIDNSNINEIIQKFFENLPSPYLEKVSQSSVPFTLQYEIEYEEALTAIAKNLCSGVSLEDGRFPRDPDTSKKVALEILGCYPGTPRVFANSVKNVFPVGHRAETTYFLVWPTACAVLTFLGWD